MNRKATPMEVFDGVMLSDGCLEKNDRETAVNFAIALSGVVHLDWLKYTRDALKRLEIPIYGDWPRLYDRKYKGKPYTVAKVQSGSCAFLASQYVRWYPNGKKIVPRDVVLTPTVLANWFMGDGSSAIYSHTGRPSSKYVPVWFCTDAYNVEDVDFLKGHLIKLGFLHTSKKENRERQWRIFMTEYYDVVRFMDMVEPYMCRSFLYKVKKPVSIRQRR